MKEKILKKLGRIRYKLKKKGIHIPIPQKLQDVAVKQLPEHVYFEGHKIFLLSKGPLSVNLFFRGKFEENETMLVKNEIHNGDVVLDLGANIGYYTLLFANLVGSKGKVFSFEPEPKNFELLKKNVKVNGYENVVTERTIVSNSNGKTKLFLSEKNPGNHRIFRQKTNRNNNFIYVKKIDLDTYFKNNPLSNKISFMKIDVEGSEIEVLQGMKSILQHNTNLKILLEFSPSLIKNFGAETTELLDFLKTNGYSFFLINSKGLVPTDEKYLLEIPMDSECNIFCKRV